MSADLKAPVTIVIPDDFPSVFNGTPAHDRCKKLGETRVFSARGADDEAELIKRIDSARVAINIRAHARFTEGVMAACRKLELISIWGTGTDNIDLDAAGRHGITVCNTPGVNAFAVAEHTLALMLATARRILASELALALAVTEEDAQHRVDEALSRRRDPPTPLPSL